MRNISRFLLAGFFLAAPYTGFVSAEPAKPDPAPAATPAPAPPPVFPVIQCTFDISFMNTGDNIYALRQCPHFADKTKYVVIFSNVTVRSDEGVSTGTFAVKTSGDKLEDTTKGAQVTFKLPAPGGTWNAPGPIVREDTAQYPGQGAVAVIQFIDKGCGDNAKVNCAIAGTLTIRAKDP